MVEKKHWPTVAFMDGLWFNQAMNKQKAIELLGGSVTAAAAAVGVSYHAIAKWPDVLPRRIADRVEAALYRQLTAKRRRKAETV
jgi:transcriptional repressor of cell division inhibition gene dicB